MKSRRPGWPVLALLAFTLGCSDASHLVDGTWRGTNAQYQQVTFTLTQSGDSLHGYGSVTLASPLTGEVQSVLNGVRRADTVYIWGAHAAPSSGALYVMIFQGQLSGSGLAGSFNVMALTPSTILLRRTGPLGNFGVGP